MRDLAQQQACDGTVGDLDIHRAADLPIAAPRRVADQGSGEALRLGHGCVQIRQLITLHTVSHFVRGTYTKDIVGHAS